MKTLKEKIATYLEKGWTAAKIAEKLGCSVASVYNAKKDQKGVKKAYQPKESVQIAHIDSSDKLVIGVKNDHGKVRKSLLPEGVLYEILEVLEHGAAKYGEFNWKYVEDGHTRYYDAADRHIEEWWNGEILDPESGCHHLAHAICSLMFAMSLDKK